MMKHGDIPNPLESVTRDVATARDKQLRPKLPMWCSPRMDFAFCSNITTDKTPPELLLINDVAPAFAMRPGVNLSVPSS